MEAAEGDVFPTAMRGLACPGEPLGCVAPASEGRRRRADEFTAVTQEEAMQHPIMRGLDGGCEGRDENTGEALLNDVFDLIRRRLSHLPLNDPARPALAALCPMLARALGRPQVVEVPEARLHA